LSRARPRRDTGAPQALGSGDPLKRAQEREDERGAGVPGVARQHFESDVWLLARQ
jgi:hypothetical protein